MSLEEAVEDADCLAIIVNHQDYAELDPVDIAARMRNGRLFLAIMSKNIQPWIDAGYMVRQLGCGWTEPAPSELIEQNLFSWV
jgi:UDP-N-acetyl-D-mannosaminuronic acid dehydrogenase